MISRCKHNSVIKISHTTKRWLSLHLKMRSKRIHFTVTWTTMHCSGFEVNNKPRDLPSALFFFIRKRTVSLSFSFTRGKVFPPTSKNEDPVKIVLKSLKKKGLNMILDRSRDKEQSTRFAVINEFDQGLRFVHNPTKSTKRRSRQNRLEIT